MSGGGYEMTRPRLAGSVAATFLTSILDVSSLQAQGAGV
jgi:hypothetical protein